MINARKKKEHDQTPWIRCNHSSTVNWQRKLSLWDVWSHALKWSQRNSCKSITRYRSKQYELVEYTPLENNSSTISRQTYCRRRTRHICVFSNTFPCHCWSVLQANSIFDFLNSAQKHANANKGAEIKLAKIFVHDSITRITYALEQLEK